MNQFSDVEENRNSNFIWDFDRRLGGGDPVEVRESVKVAVGCCFARVKVG